MSSILFFWGGSNKKNFLKVKVWSISVSRKSEVFFLKINFLKLRFWSPKQLFFCIFCFCFADLKILVFFFLGLYYPTLLSFSGSLGIDPLEKLLLLCSLFFFLNFPISTNRPSPGGNQVRLRADPHLALASFIRGSALLGNIHRPTKPRQKSSRA